MISFVFSILGVMLVGGVLYWRNDWLPEYSVSWIRSTAILPVVIGTVVLILFTQYRNRSSVAGRCAAIGLFALTVALYVQIPFGFELAAQSWLSSERPDISSV